ncbi:hypothetical protein BJY04DRAFT_196809 [Aspergillus karnatakaensis]|uniref:uncharacterized protein n=1 Tax=Aspergillus karnatakaensis TaxID=1810916 RepID=UPI003CCDFF81
MSPVQLYPAPEQGELRSTAVDRPARRARRKGIACRICMFGIWLVGGFSGDFVGVRWSLA